MRNLILIIALLGIAQLATVTAILEGTACTFMGNFDYPGNDLWGYEQKMNTVEECCDLCTKRAECVAWTFMTYSNWTYGKCFLKSAVSSPVLNTVVGREFLSGIVSK